MGMEAAVESYLARLDKALGPIAVSERASIITEIKSHILEARGRNPKKSVNSILDSLGEPESVANRYLMEKGLPLGKPAKKPVVKWLTIGCLGSLGMICLTILLLTWTFASNVTVSDKNVKVSVNGQSINVLTGRPDRPKATAEDLEKMKSLEGWYRQEAEGQEPGDDYWKVTANDGTLQVKAIWGEFELDPVKGMEFEVYQWPDSRFTFQTSKEGHPLGLKEIKNGQLNKAFTHVVGKKQSAR